MRSYNPAGPAGEAARRNPRPGDRWAGAFGGVHEVAAVTEGEVKLVDGHSLSKGDFLVITTAYQASGWTYILPEAP